eukprot:140073-Hanusia_phi.AAC.3
MQVRAKFDYFGLRSKVEEFVINYERNLFLRKRVGAGGRVKVQEAEVVKAVDGRERQERRDRRTTQSLAGQLISKSSVGWTNGMACRSSR